MTSTAKTTEVAVFSGDQLALELPLQPSLGLEDFIVSPANSQAFERITRYPNNSLFLYGAKGTGKTHLTSIWCELTRGKRFEASALPLNIQLANIAPAIAIEDIDTPTVDQYALFNTLNVARTNQTILMITAKEGLNQLAITLPDLMSRLRVFAQQQLGSPDDDLLRKVLIKHFADRQLVITSSLINYIAVRMERSLDAAGRIVEQIDKGALANKRPITVNLAAKIMTEMGYR